MFFMSVKVCSAVLSVCAVCCWLSSSVLVLAANPWSAAASGLHVLCSVSPADFLGPERNPTEIGEQLCQLQFHHCSHKEEKHSRVPTWNYTSKPGYTTLSPHAITAKIMKSTCSSCNVKHGNVLIIRKHAEMYVSPSAWSGGPTAVAPKL